MARTIISGRVVKGLGKGRYFMRRSEYRRQFIRRLGMDPYSGTLNLKLSVANRKKLERLKRRRGILIMGFEKDGKRFGDVSCYRARIGTLRCAIVAPKRSVHTDVAEVIAPSRLRRSLKLRDGSIVRVSVSA
jgi:riboflavin kinase, archaea type